MVAVCGGRGAGVFVPSLGLLVLRGLHKKGGVRINPLFFAPTSRTLGGVGLVALEFWRHKKGGIDDLGVCERNLKTCFFSNGLQFWGSVMGWALGDIIGSCGKFLGGENKPYIFLIGKIA